MDAIDVVAVMPTTVKGVKCSESDLITPATPRTMRRSEQMKLSKASVMVLKFDEIIASCAFMLIIFDIRDGFHV